MKRLIALVATTVILVSTAQAQVTKESVPAITNLRQPTEQGADIEAETAAAKAAGIKFYNIPFNNAAPDPAVVDRFLLTISQPGNQPAFIHCGSGNRAAGMWFVKRVLLDNWDVERASTEAASLGLANPALKTFMMNYIESHKK